MFSSLFAAGVGELQNLYLFTGTPSNEDSHRKPTILFRVP